MSDKGGGLILPDGALPPGFVTDLSITKEDVLSIIVSKKEQELLKAKDKADKRLDAICDEKKKANEELEKTIKDAGEELLGKAVKKINAILKAAGGGGELKIEAEIHNDDEGYLHLAIVDRTSPFKKPVTPKVKKAQKAVKDLDDEREKVEKDAVAARRDLARLPSEERKFRAKLAHRVLSQGAAGQKFLKEFEGS